MSTEKLLNTSEAAFMLGISVSTLYRWIDKGYVEYINYPSNVKRFRESEIKRIIREGTINKKEKGEKDDTK